MSTNPHHEHPRARRLNPALCASALSRLSWAFGALVLLWGSVYWAMS